LVLTTFELDEYVFGALDAAATGVLLKGGEPADRIHAIRVVAAGEALLAPSVTRRLIDTYVATAQPTAHTDHDTLDEPTNREREVLGLVTTGLTNAEIAQQLHLSPLTAKTHVSRILMKLGARDRSAARRHRLPQRNGPPTAEPATRMTRGLHAESRFQKHTRFDETPQTRTIRGARGLTARRGHEDRNAADPRPQADRSAHAEDV
jgi:Bacterial regulatory proteins, luxR family